MAKPLPQSPAFYEYRVGVFSTEAEALPMAPRFRFSFLWGAEAPALARAMQFQFLPQLQTAKPRRQRPRNSSHGPTTRQRAQQPFQAGLKLIAQLLRQWLRIERHPWLQRAPQFLTRRQAMEFGLTRLAM